MSQEERITVRQDEDHTTTRVERGGGRSWPLWVLLAFAAVCIGAGWLGVSRMGDDDTDESAETQVAGESTTIPAIQTELGPPIDTELEVYYGYSEGCTTGVEHGFAAGHRGESPTDVDPPPNFSPEYIRGYRICFWREFKRGLMVAETFGDETAETRSMTSNDGLYSIEMDPEYELGCLVAQGDAYGYLTTGEVPVTFGNSIDPEERPSLDYLEGYWLCLWTEFSNADTIGEPLITNQDPSR